MKVSVGKGVKCNSVVGMRRPEWPEWSEERSPKSTPATATTTNRITKSKVIGQPT